LSIQFYIQQVFRLTFGCIRRCPPLTERWAMWVRFCVGTRKR